MDEEKALDKTQHLSMIKNTQQTRTRREVLNLIMDIYTNPQLTILHGETLKACPLGSGIKDVHSHC